MDAGLWGVGGGEQALTGLPPLTCLSLLAEPPPLPSGFISEHSTSRAGGTGAARSPKNGVPASPLPPPHILQGLHSLAGGGVGFLGSSWWEKGLEVLSSPILQKLLDPVPLKRLAPVSALAPATGSCPSCGCARRLWLVLTFLTSACSLLLDTRLPDNSC